MLRAGGALALALVSGGCTMATAEPHGGPAASAKKPENKPMAQSGLPSVELKFTGQRPGRPPLVRLEVDAVLRNPRAEARWFVLPTNMGPGVAKGGVDIVELYELGGTGRAVMGRFGGNGGFQAYLLPPGGELKVKKVPLNHWGELPASTMTVEVVSASQITVGGEPVGRWVGSDAVSDARCDVSQAQQKLLGKKASPEGKELPVTLTDEQRVTVSVSLSHPQ